MYARAEAFARPRLGRLGIAVALGFFFLASLIGGFGTAIQPALSPTNAYDPSGIALADIPPDYLQMYQSAGDRYGIDWAILAGIGSVETNHGRLDPPCATSSAGARGPMQFMPGTWRTYGHGGDICAAQDAIPAAARLLVANGAPDNYQTALLAYNHAQWYVDRVLNKAAQYRGAMRAWEVGDIPMTATVADILGNPRIHLTAGQRRDIQQPGMDRRLIVTMAWIGQSHSIIVTALRRDHYPGTNHEAGRAFDVGSVDGHICINATPADPCGQLLLELAAVHGPLRTTELIGCFDADGPNDPRAFARADHCDHDHVGWDGPSVL